MKRNLFLLLIILRKDSLLELRGLHGIASLIVLTVVCSLGLGMSYSMSGFDPLVSARTFPGAFWTLFLAITIFAASRGYSTEIENRSYALSMLSRIPQEIVFLSKFFVFWIMNILAGLILYILLTTFLVSQSIDLYVLQVLLVIVLISGTVAAVTTLLAPISETSRIGSFFLPLISFPLLTPLILIGTEYVLLVQEGVSQGLTAYLISLFCFFCVSLFSGVVLYPSVVKTLP